MTAQKNDCLLVLGGTGNVGQHVVSWLRKNAAPTARVLVGTRSPDGISPNREGGASVQGLTCDLGNIESIRHAVRGFVTILRIVSIFYRVQKQLISVGVLLYNYGMLFRLSGCINFTTVTTPRSNKIKFEYFGNRVSVHSIL